jgi:hypothetical protein
MIAFLALPETWERIEATKDHLKALTIDLLCNI